MALYRLVSVFGRRNHAATDAGKRDTLPPPARAQTKETAVSNAKAKGTSALTART